MKQNIGYLKKRVSELESKEAEQTVKIAKLKDRNKLLELAVEHRDKAIDNLNRALEDTAEGARLERARIRLQIFQTLVGNSLSTEEVTVEKLNVFEDWVMEDHTPTNSIYKGDFFEVMDEDSTASIKHETNNCTCGHGRGCNRRGHDE